MLAVNRCRIFCLLVWYPKNIKITIYRTISLPVVLYGCETWSLTLREERELRVSENGELRRIVGLERDEIRWGWRKLHGEEIKDLYSSSDIRGKKSRRVR